MIIYKTINLINGKFYVGKDSKNNPNYLGSGLYLKRAVNKYGIENFKKEILEYCNNLKELCEREKFWIKELDAINKGYNIAEGGKGGKTQPIIYNKGKTLEQIYGKEKALEIQNKLHQSHLGILHTQEQKDKIGNAHRGMKRTEETKKNISQALSGRKIKKDVQRKISNSIIEWFKDPENKEKHIKSQQGKILSDEHKQKISNSLKGIKREKRNIHPGTCIWYFYNQQNELIFTHSGNYCKFLSEHHISFRKTKKFDNLNDCLNFNSKYQYKVYFERYYKKN